MAYNYENFQIKIAVEIARTVETTNGCGDNFLSASLIDLEGGAVFAENPIYETKKLKEKWIFQVPKP